MESHENTFPELIARSAQVESTLVENAGELTPELEKEYTELKILIPQKVDGYKFIIDRFRSLGDWWINKGKIFISTGRGLHKFADFLSSGIKLGMAALKIKELLGVDYRFVLANSKPTLEIFDEAQLPAHCIKEVVEYVPDKDKIRELLDAGAVISGARLVPNKSLRSYMNKSETKKKVGQKNAKQTIVSKSTKKTGKTKTSDNGTKRVG